MASRIPPGGAGIRIDDDHDPGSEAARRGAEALQTLLRMADQWHAEQARRRDYEERRGTHPGAALAEAGGGRGDDRALRGKSDGRDPTPPPPPDGGRGEPPADPEPPEPGPPDRRTWAGDQPDPGPDDKARPQPGLGPDQGDPSADPQWDGQRLRTAAHPEAAESLADRITRIKASNADTPDAESTADAEPAPGRHLHLVPDRGDDAEAAAAEQAAALDRAAIWAADDHDPSTTPPLHGTNPAAGNTPLELDAIGDARSTAGAEAALDTGDPLDQGRGDPLQDRAGDPLAGAPPAAADDDDRDREGPRR